MVAVLAASNKSLEALRIRRPEEKTRRKRKPGVLLAMIILATAIGAAAAYEVYFRTVGRPQTVQTIMVLSNRSGQPGVMLTGSGYVVTRHKYITIGTKILGTIVSEPIEEGQRVRIGDLLAKIDDRDYQAQLRQAAAARDISESNLRLALAKAQRARDQMATGIISKDTYETAIIDRCINNRKRTQLLLGWVHEASGKWGGAGAASAEGSAAVARRPFAVDGGTDGGRGGERGVAVAGDLASQGRAGASSQAYSRAATQTDLPTTPAFAQAARLGRPELRLP